MWKLIKGSLTRMELGDQKGELSHPTTTTLPIAEPTGRGSSQADTILLPQQEEERFSLSPPKRDRPYTSDSQLKRIDFLFITAPPNSFLHKKAFLSFALQTCLWFCCSLHVLNCNYLLFLSTPIFAGKITDSFMFNNYILLTGSQLDRNLLQDESYLNSHPYLILIILTSDFGF